MFSYQQEWSDKIVDIVNAIKNWEFSETRDKLLLTMEYFQGKNRFIDNVKRMFCKEETVEKEDGTKENVVYVRENKYVPNYKTYYGFYSDMVSQKVNALLNEIPQIAGLDFKKSRAMGRAMKSAGTKASVQGYSIIYEKIDNNYIVFDTENCLVYLDDITREIKRLVRYWYIVANNKSTRLCFEIYDEKGITTYAQKINNAQSYEMISYQPYKLKISSSKFSNNFIEEQISMPIILFKNNDDMLPDLSPKIKSKIDMVDLILSGLCNNIQEFSEIWLTANVGDMSIEEAQAVKQTWAYTRTLLTNQQGSADIRTIEIPYQARQTTIQMLKRELNEDAGTIDFSQIQGNATATEINARTYKLKQRVSDFEWYADEAMTKMVQIYQDYNNLNFDIDITFTQLFISNNLELVNIANSVYGKISTESYLNLLKQANIIEDVSEELKKLDEESLSKFDLEVDDDTKFTQSIQQTTEPKI